MANKSHVDILNEFAALSRYEKSQLFNALKKRLYQSTPAIEFDPYGTISRLCRDFAGEAVFCFFRDRLGILE
jgi:hypothetical protein